MGRVWSIAAAVFSVLAVVVCAEPLPEPGTPIPGSLIAGVLLFVAAGACLWCSENPR